MKNPKKKLSASQCKLLSPKKPNFLLRKIVRFEEENSPKKKMKLNPADLNFMPNPQYLLDNKIHEYMDIETPKNKEKTVYVIPKNDRILMGAGIFKKIEKKSRVESFCVKCNQLADLIETSSNLTFCEKHGIDRIIQNPSLLSEIEI